MNGRGFSPSYANLVKDSHSKKSPYERDVRGGREPRGVYRTEDRKEHKLAGAESQAAEIVNSIKSPQ